MQTVQFAPKQRKSKLAWREPREDALPSGTVTTWESACGGFRIKTRDAKSYHLIECTVMSVNETSVTKSWQPVSQHPTLYAAKVAAEVLACRS